MFSKALFKQSCKANGTMWAVITFAVCFMLAAVMLISGKGGISNTITSIQDTIISEEIDSSLETRAINYYELQSEGMHKFDEFFVVNLQEEVTKNGLSNIEQVATNAYSNSIAQLQEYVYAKALAINPSYTPESNEAQEMLGAIVYAINPPNPDDMSKGKFDDFYTSHQEEIPSSYLDRDTIISHYFNLSQYFAGEERAKFIDDRAKICASIFLAGNSTSQDNIDKIVQQLEKFRVTKEKYESFGYTYANVKKLATDSIITYASRLEAELTSLDKEASDYPMQVATLKNSIAGDISQSLLSSLPAEVASALEEIGQLNLYGIVVGSIFYKLAGLLLPIIYMIMAANNLISGQVDSGSMAYVLSTSTKRKTIVFTQAVYLISSLFVMFTLTTLTSVVCLAIVGESVAQLTYSKIILLNLGAFLVLFALSGLCFFTSCFFDRSKRSMAIGGGLSIFALVAAMLGLFGSHVIPSVVRLAALNNFNYVTIITLFDVISIIDGSLVFIWKFVILFVLGLIGYLIGSIKFVKKDLPL